MAPPLRLELDFVGLFGGRGLWLDPVPGSELVDALPVTPTVAGAAVADHIHDVYMQLAPKVPRAS